MAPQMLRFERRPTKEHRFDRHKPPYVTSYEYAGLHQLSSLWLGFASDYRSLREGSIGRSRHALDVDREIKRLNQTGGRVVFSLFDQDRAIARAGTCR